MSRYIKSHSNYIVQKKHQDVNDGKIYEYDAVTTGNIDQFSAGQIPIYRSGNFLITVNDGNSESRNILSKSWIENGNGNSIWDTSSLSGYTSDYEGSLDYKISLKKDNYDLRDFAYYGSCSDLIKNSIENILDKFPGEMYGPYSIGESGDVIGYEEYYTDLSSTANENAKVKIGYKAKWGDKDEDPLLIKSISCLPDNIYLVENPFGIDAFTTHISASEISSPIKYFANDGYQNYEVIDNSGNTHSILEWDVREYDTELVRKAVSTKDSNLIKSASISANTEACNSINDCIIFLTDNDGKKTVKITQSEYDVTVPSDENVVYGMTGVCPGDYLGRIMILCNDGFYIKLYVFLGDNYKPVYMTEAKYLGCHIRPKSEFYDYDFIEGLSLFEKVLMGVNSDKRYNAALSVISEDSSGYISSVQNFQFPIGDGGYNIASDTDAYYEYIKELSKISEFYDDRFCDNLYRSMTHEAIKNFDWTNGVLDDKDSEAIKESSSKVGKLIRLTGFEFDNVLSYIDNIGTCNTVTYDGKNNMPDYFLTDSLDNSGWDVKLIYPFELSEFYVGNDGKKYGTDSFSSAVINESANTYTADGNVYPLSRVFKEDTTLIVTPYDNSMYEYPYGYYLSCIYPCFMSVTDDNGIIQYKTSNVTDSSISIQAASATSEDVVYDAIKNRILRKISSFSSDAEYTVPQVNNEFMRRLKINSPYIFRKKGTIEGIESILALFGMKSKYWYSSLPESSKKYISEGKTPYDYEINEFTSFTPPITENVWYKSKNLYKYDFYNSCKTISYDTDTYINGEYISYQGLPVTYRESKSEYVYSGKTDGTTTKDTKKAYIDNDGNYVPVRYLYPNFESDGIYDGNPYYQMNGGWGCTSPYKFDKDNNIITEYGNSYKSPLFGESIRTIHNVSDITGLLSLSSNDVADKEIYYVNNLSTNYAIIDGSAYQLFSDTDGSISVYYFEVSVFNNSLIVGDKYFDGNVVISDFDNGSGTTYTYNLNAIDDGTQIRIYCLPDGKGKYSVTARTENPDDSSNNSDITIENVNVFINGKMSGISGITTNYFRFNNVDGNTDINVGTIGYNGWEQLTTTDKDYYRLNSIVDVYTGNNPHKGNFIYDNGYEYFTYFRRIFKFSYENQLFDTTCFSSEDSLYSSISGIGFTNLIHESDDATDYDYSEYLYNDRKVHYFGDKYVNSVSFSDYASSALTSSFSYVNDDLLLTPEDAQFFDTLKYKYSSIIREYLNNTSLLKKEYSLDGIDDSSHYSLKTVSRDGSYTSDSYYGKGINGSDGVTNQIMNNKILKITFYLKNSTLYSIPNIEETKYIQSVIMPYVEQMVPSNSILVTEFK